MAWLTKPYKPGYQFDAKQVERESPDDKPISAQRIFIWNEQALDRCWDIHLIATKNW